MKTLRILLPAALLPFLLGCAHQPPAGDPATPSAPVAPAAERMREAAAYREKGMELLYAKDPRVKNPAKAFELLQKSAELGDPVAMDSLGGFYGLGLAGVPRDCRKAMEWFEKSAAAGYGLAANNLAFLYLTCPDKSLRNTEKAEEIMRTVFASNPTLPAVLDTYAALLATQGEFAKAIATMKVVIDLEDLIGLNPEQIDEAKTTLAIYQKHRLPNWDQPKKKQGKR